MSVSQGSIHPSLLSLAFDVDRLQPLPGNPRRGDVDAIARSYARFGQRKPIVARGNPDDGGTVLAGNHQLAAAIELGWPQIAVVFVTDDDEHAAAYALADNRTAELGDYDRDALTALIAQVASDDELLMATGWTEADVAKMLPAFAPTEDVGGLDRVSPVVCPDCGFAWRLGPGGEVVEMEAQR